MKILITGASGFIGRHVMTQALARGLDLVGCHSGRDASYRDLPGYAECDLLQPGACAALCRKERPSHLLHLAWGLPSVTYWSSPDNLRWLTASLSLFESFMEFGGTRAVGLGTCTEYSPVASPRNELTTPTVPDTVYGQSKLALCHAVLALAAARGSSCAWARLFYPFGPGDAPHRLLPSACQAFLEGRKFTTAASERIFDFIDARDAASMLLDLLLSDFTGIMNIAGGEGRKAAELLTTAAMLSGRKDLLEYSPQKKVEGPIIADTTLWRNTFGTPTLRTVESSLRDLLDNARNEADAP